MGKPMDISYTGPDGFEWNLSGKNEGKQGAYLDLSPQGMQEAPRKGIWSQSAFQEGATFMGVSVEPIDMVLGIQIDPVDGMDWADVSARFRDSWSYDEDGILRYTTPESGVRELKVRLLEAPDRATKKDGRLNEYSIEAYTIRAGWPYYTSGGAVDSFTVDLKAKPPEGIWEEFSAALAKLFKLELNFGHYDEGFVTVENPTDVPMYLQWVLSAPGRWAIPDYSFKDDEDATRVVVCPTLDEGEHLSIDTYPRNEPYVSSTNTNIAGRFGGVLFLNPIPPHTPPTKIPVSYVGEDPEASAVVIMRHNWLSPFGGERHD